VKILQEVLGGATFLTHTVEFNKRLHGNIQYIQKQPHLFIF